MTKNNKSVGEEVEIYLEDLGVSKYVAPVLLFAGIGFCVFGSKNKFCQYLGKTMLTVSGSLLLFPIKKQMSINIKERNAETCRQKKVEEREMEIQKNRVRTEDAKAFSDVLKGGETLETRCLVSDWIGLGQVNEIWARSGEGKSFLAMQMAFYIASGGTYQFSNRFIDQPYAPKKPQPVHYISLEMDESAYSSRYNADVIKSLDGLNIRHQFIEQKRCDVDCLLQYIRDVVDAATSDITIFVDHLASIPEFSHSRSVLKFFGGIEDIQKRARSREIEVTFVLIHQVNRVAKNKLIEGVNVKGSLAILERAANVIALEPTRFEGQKMLRVLKTRLNADKSKVRLFEYKNTLYRHFDFQKYDAPENVCYIQAKAAPLFSQKTTSCRVNPAIFEGKEDLLREMIKEIDTRHITQEDAIKKYHPWKRTKTLKMMKLFRAYVTSL